MLLAPIARPTELTAPIRPSKAHSQSVTSSGAPDEDNQRPATQYSVSLQQAGHYRSERTAIAPRRAALPLSNPLKPLRTKASSERDSFHTLIPRPQSRSLNPRPQNPAFFPQPGILSLSPEKSPEKNYL